MILDNVNPGLIHPWFMNGCTKLDRNYKHFGNPPDKLARVYQSGEVPPTILTRILKYQTQTTDQISPHFHVSLLAAMFWSQQVGAFLSNYSTKLFTIEHHKRCEPKDPNKNAKTITGIWDSPWCGVLNLWLDHPQFPLFNGWFLTQKQWHLVGMIQCLLFYISIMNDENPICLEVSWEIITKTSG